MYVYIYSIYTVVKIDLPKWWRFVRGYMIIQYMAVAPSTFQVVFRHRHSGSFFVLPLFACLYLSVSIYLLKSLRSLRSHTSRLTSHAVMFFKTKLMPIHVMLYIDMSYPCCCIMLHLDTTQCCNYVVICCMYIYIYYPDILELDKKR